MKRFLLSLILALLIPASIFAQWETTTSLNTSENLYDVFFLNQSTGWVVGNNLILKTVDGGENWIEQSPAVSNTRYYDVYFLDENNGWAVGKSVTGTSGRIHYTNDGGENWNVFFVGGSPLPWWSIDFAGSSNGVAVGQEGQILYTSDGGANWSSRNSPSGDAGIIREVEFYDGLNGIAVGYSSPSVGFIMKTTDGGNSWTNIDTNIAGGLNAVSFKDNLIGVAVGSSGSIYRTVDGGNSWTQITSGTTQSLRAVHFNGPIAITVGFSGTILKSGDSGLNWDAESTNSTGALRGIHLTGANSGFAVGSFGEALSYCNECNNMAVFNIDYKETEVEELEMDDLSIAADNSTSTKFQFSGNDFQNVRLRIKEDENGQETELWGSFNEGVTNPENKEFKYTHPEYFNLEGQKVKEATIEVYNSLNNEIITEYPFKIVRPSVLMVHGIWAGPNSFDNLEAHLIDSGMYENYQIHKAAYINDISNTESITAYISDKEHLINFWTLSNNISVGKIDVIAHSNGGLLSRYYIQGSALGYDYDINKLITLNTPHSGSQLANRLLTTFSWAQPILSLMGKNANNGIIDGLRVDGSFIRTLNSNMQNYNEIGVHTISSTLSVTELVNFDTTNWDVTLGLLIYYHLNAINEGYNDYLFNGSTNDIIVPLNSQIGGASVTTPFTDQIHMGSNANDEIQTKLRQLLNSNPSDSNFFSNNGFNPDPIIYNPDAGRDSWSQKLTESMSIMSPAAGTDYLAGTDVTINSTGSSNINTILTSMGNTTISIQNEVEENNSSSTTTFTIPEDAIGRLDIVAVGFDDSGYAAYDNTFINVTTNASLESMRIINEEITVYENFTQIFRLLGQYNDGKERDITNVNGIAYNFNNNNAEIEQNGIIKGLIEGEDVLTVTYLGIQTSAPISILNSVSLSLADENASNTEEDVFIYPNPTKDIINLNFLNNSRAKIIIYDTTGKKILTDEIENTNSNQINISSLNNGIYFIKIETNEKSVTKKIMKN